MAANSDIQGREHLEMSRKAHRSVVRTRIVIPVLVCGAALVIVPLLLAIGLGGYRFGTAASLMSVCLTLPLSIVCIITYAGFVAATFGMAKVYGNTARIMRGIHDLAHRVNMGVKDISRRIGKPFVTLDARFTYIETAIEHTVGGLLPSGDEDSQDDE